MATKAEAENESEDLPPIENCDLKAVCKNLQFSDDKLKIQPTRKRCVSTSILINSSPKKKKKEAHNIKPPNKFLLGGNISDPLNLNSLQDEDVNRAMNKTPKSSPLHSNKVNIKKDQVDVLIPRNLADPLELSTCVEAKQVNCFGNLLTLKRRTPQKRKTKKQTTKLSSDCSLLTENTPVLDDEPDECDGSGEDIIYPLIKIQKTETSENWPQCMPENNNVVVSSVMENIIEEIIQKVQNEETEDNSCSTQLICQKEISELAIPKIIVQEVQEEVIPEPNKSLSPSPVKKVKDDKETQKLLDKIESKNSEVSPVVEKTSSPDKSAIKTSLSTKLSTKPKNKLNKNEPKFKEKNALFQYGNYNRYYGYRNTEDGDNRLKVLAARMDLFYGKDVLDIGCNIGHVTFSVARDFGARSVVGMDIDRKLINIARKNVQHYISNTSNHPKRLAPNYNDMSDAQDKNRINDIVQSFPMSMPMLYGPINLPGIQTSGKFPFNVSFIQGNYVLESNVMLGMETCQFDVILCLSITKWIHLNWGDDGLKRAFKRMFAQLRPGGILVLEPQSWKSYSRKKTLTETIWRNYKTIELRPPLFTEYLLTEVGFAHCETLAMPYNPSKGFQRPLKLYRKPTNVVLATKNDMPKCSTVIGPSETVNEPRI